MLTPDYDHIKCGQCLRVNFGLKWRLCLKSIRLAPPIASLRPQNCLKTLDCAPQIAHTKQPMTHKNERYLRNTFRDRAASQQPSL
jgi:hypothetical protein